MSPLTIHILIISILIIGLVVLYIIQYRRLKARFSSNKIESVLKEKLLLEQLFNNMPDRIYFKDRDSRFIIANKYVSKIMGQKDPKALIGKSDFDFYEEKLAQPYFEDEQRIMKEGIPMISKEEKGLDLEGNEVFVSTTKIPIRDSHNNVIGIIGIGRDITPQKEAEKKLKEKTESLEEINVLLEERQEEIQQMAEELSAQADHLKQVNIDLQRLSLASKTDNTVIIMDSNGNFEWANEGFKKRYGGDLESFKLKYGVNLRENSSNENISGVLNQIYITKKPYSYNSKNLDENGKEIWSQTNISPVLDSNNEIINLVLIDSDITELKLAESKIKVQNDEIISKSRELVTLNATKDRLFSIIAHDLRNPFHSILGLTEILKNRQSEFGPEKMNEFLQLILDSAKSASQLLENLLDWARSQTDSIKMNPRPISLYEMVEEVIALEKLQASNKNVNFTNNVDQELMAYADRNMINTVIRNITSNAVKYSKEGDFVKFSGLNADNETFLDISDSGTGIPEDKLKTLFRLDMVKSTPGTAGEAGTGLGLIVCYEFMTKNKGSVSVTSKPGKGSTFRLGLPSRENT